MKYKIDYAFDPVGNVTNRVITGLQGLTESITTRYQYDTMNRLTNVVQLTNAAVTASAWYSYDCSGRLWQKGYGNGDVVTHTYDTESRLLSLGITNNSTLVTCYSYGWDTGGNILAITNNGTNVSLYGYDRAGQLTNEVCLTNGVAGGQTNAWQYDEAGNWLNANATNRWHYNADNELIARVVTNDGPWDVTVTGEVEPGPKSNKWYHTTVECRGVSALVSQADGTFSLPNVPLDPGTNDLLVTVTDVTGNTTQQVRQVTKSTLETFGYDGNGNLTNWVSGTTNWVYEWDWADRLTKVTSNDVVVLENWYDTKNRRIAKVELFNGQLKKALYVYDGWQSVAALGQNGCTLETYTRGKGFLGDVATLVAVTHRAGSITNGVFYAHNDQRGDSVAIRHGNVTLAQYGYTGFGIIRRAEGAEVCRFKFSTKEQDVATGLCYYGFRFYSPRWQRWLSADPLGMSARLLARNDRRPLQNDTFVNLYMFVHNDPVNFHDPLGLRGYWPCVGQVLWCEALSLACPGAIIVGIKACVDLSPSPTAAAACWCSLPAAVGAACYAAWTCWQDAYNDGCIGLPPVEVPDGWPPTY